MDVFVALRVFVRAGETNRAALNRTLREGRVKFPMLPPHHQLFAPIYNFPSDIPDHDYLVGPKEYAVKYEPA